MRAHAHLDWFVLLAHTHQWLMIKREVARSTLLKAKRNEYIFSSKLCMGGGQNVWVGQIMYGDKWVYGSFSHLFSASLLLSPQHTAPVTRPSVLP